jgi:hypothetical protein
MKEDERLDLLQKVLFEQVSWNERDNATVNLNSAAQAVSVLRQRSRIRVGAASRERGGRPNFWETALLWCFNMHQGRRIARRQKWR